MSAESLSEDRLASVIANLESDFRCPATGNRRVQICETVFNRADRLLIEEEKRQYRLTQDQKDRLVNLLHQGAEAGFEGAFIHAGFALLMGKTLSDAHKEKLLDAFRFSPPNRRDGRINTLCSLIGGPISPLSAAQKDIACLRIAKIFGKQKDTDAQLVTVLNKAMDFAENAPALSVFLTDILIERMEKSDIIREKMARMVNEKLKSPRFAQNAAAFDKMTPQVEVLAVLTAWLEDDAIKQHAELSGVFNGCEELAHAYHECAYREKDAPNHPVLGGLRHILARLPVAAA